jgi:hypothetical protein
MRANAKTITDTRKKRAQRLFAALKKARNKKPVGRLERAKLYDRFERMEGSMPLRNS